MGKETSLISGFSGTDSKRVDLFLQKLTPHLVEGNYLIVGGLAIRYHLNKHGIDYLIRDFNDLDLEVPSINVVKPSVQNEFLIYHYHPQVNDSFFVALVEPVTKIKVDIFKRVYKGRDRRYLITDFHGLEVKVTEVEDQLVKTVYDISRIAENDKVDPKQFKDTKLLMQIANMELANQIWQGENYENYPENITSSIERAENISKEKPEWVVEKPFRHPKPYICPNCKNVPDFNITPMEEIYKAIGYVE